MQISNRSRIRFGEFATGCSVLRQIHNVFQSEDFTHAEPWDSFDAGERRSLVAAYHANVDFSNANDVVRLARVYADAINTWGRATPTGDLAPADYCRSSARCNSTGYRSLTTGASRSHPPRPAS